VTRYAARFSIRALDVTVDATVLWVGAALAIAAAVLLAFVPRLPSPLAPAGLGLASGTARLTPATNRRLRIFATAQIACSFVLLTGAGMLLATLLAKQGAQTAYDVRHVLVFDVPTPATGVGYDDPAVIRFYEQVARRVGDLPGVDSAAIGSFVPWRDAGNFGPGVAFTVEGRVAAEGEDDPRARFRVVAPRFFSTVGLALLAGRDFTDEDRVSSEPVVIVSQSIARSQFPDGQALNRTMWWTDPYFGRTLVKRRIVGIVADADDENVIARPAQTIYHPVRQIGVGGRLFVRVTGDPEARIQDVRRVIHAMSPEQPVERAATLEEARAQVLSPERLNAFVFSGFAGIALLLALVGVAGVLAFSVSARTREFGVRLALGSAPRDILARVLSEGVVIASIGVAAGAAGGYALVRAATALFADVQVPGAWPVIGAAAVLIGAAIAASLAPAARAARIDVLQAIRSE
jgi:predicted permease